MSNGKGDSPRPLSVDSETFANNWERIFKTEQLKALAELTRIQEELGLYELDAFERSKNNAGEHPRIDEDGNRIEQEPC
jgi:hypothetical protein